MEYFKQAKKIFLKGHKDDEHVFVGFYKCINIDNKSKNVTIHIAARSYYKLYVNGQFASYGPARAGHEHARVDEVDISNYITAGENHIAFEIVGYKKNNLMMTAEYAFLISEIFADGKLIGYTDNSWSAYVLEKKELNKELYAHQRFFVERYNLTPDCDDWRIAKKKLPNCEIEEIEDEITYLPRGTEFPDLSLRKLDGVVYSQGIIRGKFDNKIQVFEAEKNSFVDYDFKKFAGGMVALEIEVESDCKVILEYPEKISREEGEIYSDGTYRSTHYRPAAYLNLKAGKHYYEAFEPTAIRYLRINIQGCRSYVIHNVYVRLCQISNLQGGGFICSDREITRIIDACRTAVTINTFDVLMDCAGRERGGWADPAYWTYPAFQMMMGNTSAERAHIENYLCAPLKKYFEHCPCCYPAAEGLDCVIHNWTIYLLMNIYEYYKRTGDKELILKYRDNLDWIISTLSRYENSFGLLEKLDRIIYMGYSNSDGFNDSNCIYNQPISVVTNAMYAIALKGIGEILSDDELCKKADRINEILLKVVHCSPDLYEGDCFTSDGFSIDENGNVKPNGPYTEGAQYFLMYTGLLKRDEYPNQFYRIFDHLGSLPAEKYSHDSHIFKRCGFEGDMFGRETVLYNYGEIGKMVAEIKDISLYMMDHFEGLIGEGFDWLASVHHSFGAVFAYLLEKALLGVDNANELTKTIKIDPHLLDLKWARGQISTKTGLCSVWWINNRDEFSIKVQIPEGYKVDFTIPNEVAGRDRVFTFNGDQIEYPSKGIISQIGQTFEFRSKKA